LQLDELRFAKGSPTGTAVKHDYGASPASGLMQRYHCAVLVWQHHVRKVFPHSGANLAEVNAKIRDHGHMSSFSCTRRDCESMVGDRSLIGYTLEA
jgi:hypothetical protein